MIHTHPCVRCETPVECDGQQSPNVDGFPETICASFHLGNGETAELLCGSCQDVPRCPRCGSEDWRYEGDRQICVECGR